MSETHNQAFIEAHDDQLSYIAQTIERIIPEGRFTTVVLQDGNAAEPMFLVGEHSPSSYLYADHVTDSEQLQSTADINNHVLLERARGQIAVVQAFAGSIAIENTTTEHFFCSGIWQQSIFPGRQEQASLIVEVTTLESLEIFGKGIQYQLKVNDLSLQQTLDIERLGEAIVGATITSKPVEDVLYERCLYLLDGGVPEVALALHGYFKTETELSTLIDKVRDIHNDLPTEESVNFLLDAVYQRAQAIKFEQRLDKTHGLLLPTSEDLNTAVLILQNVFGGETI